MSHEQMPPQHQIARGDFEPKPLGRTGQVSIEQEIKKRKWRRIGHTLHKPTLNITKQSFEWNPQGKRKVGRPRQNWRRSTDAEASVFRMLWAEL
jgi:hypothetical protein